MPKHPSRCSSFLLTAIPSASHGHLRERTKLLHHVPWPVANADHHDGQWVLARLNNCYQSGAMRKTMCVCVCFMCVCFYVYVRVCACMHVASNQGWVRTTEHRCLACMAERPLQQHNPTTRICFTLPPPPSALSSAHVLIIPSFLTFDCILWRCDLPVGNDEQDVEVVCVLHNLNRFANQRRKVGWPGRCNHGRDLLVYPQHLLQEDGWTRRE